MAGAPDSRTDLHLEELRERVAWLIRLRWLAIVGVLLTISVAPRLLGVSLRQHPLYLTTTGLAGYNAILWAVSRWVPHTVRGPSLSCFANVQIAIDLVFLTGLLHLSGGAENPLACYYVFHVIIASMLLSRVATSLQATFAAVLWTGTAVAEATGRLSHYHISGLLGPDVYRSPVWVFASVFGMTTMLCFSAFMATAITARLRQRESDVVRLSASLKVHSDDLERAYAVLDRLDKERSDYLHRAAHHLRSPLAALERMLAVVCEGRTGALSNSAQEMLGRARKRTRGMQDLARDLLVLSRAREASRIVRRTAVDVGDLLREALEDFQQQAAQASVALMPSIPPGAAAVIGDAEGLVELIENLLANAIKYTPAGGSVRVTLAAAASSLRLCVSDSGIGIPPAEQERIFEEFYRATNARDSGKDGTGLGLTIVKTIAEAHGGSVAVESTVGAGTTFSVLLPTSR